MNFLATIIGLGLIFIIVILTIYFRKQIILTLIRSIYGPFSFEFYHLYKRYFFRSPYQYCFRDEFMAHLFFVVSKNNKIPSYKSFKEIFFENTPFFINYEDFLKKKGKPYCFNAFAFYEPDFIIKALGYQEIIAGSKAILVFYFMNDSFFMGEYIFKNPKNNVKASLTDYFLEENDFLADNFYIENSQDRVVHYQDTGFTVDIKYLNKENQAITETLNNYFAKLTEKKLKVKT